MAPVSVSTPAAVARDVDGAWAELRQDTEQAELRYAMLLETLVPGSGALDEAMTPAKERRGSAEGLARELTWEELIDQKEQAELRYSLLLDSFVPSTPSIGDACATSSGATNRSEQSQRVC